MGGQGLHLHLDPVGGAAGDMFIAAMLDAFPDLVERALADVAAVLPAEVGRAELSEHIASGITARRFELVLAAEGAGSRHGAETTYRAMRDLLERAPLLEGTAAAACAILHRIAEAEVRAAEALAESALRPGAPAANTVGRADVSGVCKSRRAAPS